MHDTAHNRAAFAAIMLGVAENYGQTLTAEGGNLRFKALQAFELADIERAAMSLIANRKYTSMPTVADFLEHLGGGSLDDKAEVEAGKVLQAVSAVGGYQSVVFDDPVTQAVIQQTFGGWARLCRESSLKEEKWWRRDFIHAYGSYARQGISLSGYLPGQCEIDNSAGVFSREIPAPVAVGSAQKAALVLAGAQAELPQQLASRDKPLHAARALPRVNVQPLPYDRHMRLSAPTAQ